jgi:F-type H+-transporting ATPase subunit b
MKRCLTKQKRSALVLFAGLILLPILSYGQEAAPAASQSSEKKTEEDDGMMKWKVINFAIFAVGLGYVIIKNAPTFFNARSADIQKAIKEATGLKMEADLRYSEVDRKMANLAGEVEKIRAEAKVEMQHEHERMLNETKQEIEHIHRNVAAETEGLQQEGALKVRQHTTRLALALAERRLRDRFAGSQGDDLLQDFVNLVDRGKN